MSTEMGKDTGNGVSANSDDCPGTDDQIVEDVECRCGITLVPPMSIEGD